MISTPPTYDNTKYQHDTSNHIPFTYSQSSEDFKMGNLLHKGDVTDIWEGTRRDLINNTEDFVHIVTYDKRTLGNAINQERLASLLPKVGDVQHPHILRYLKIVQNEERMGIIMEHPKVGGLPLSGRYYVDRKLLVFRPFEIKLKSS